MSTDSMVNITQPRSNSLEPSPQSYTVVHTRHHEIEERADSSKPAAIDPSPIGGHLLH